MRAARKAMHSHLGKREEGSTLAVLEKSLRESLLNTAQSYHNQLKDNPAAMEYWAGRGLTEETVRRFGLGFVDEPAEEADASFKGRLSIPYLRYSAVHGATCVGFKFRSFGDDKPKYLYRKGLNPRLFNTAAIQRDTEFICVAEERLTLSLLSRRDCRASAFPALRSGRTTFPGCLWGTERFISCKTTTRPAKQWRRRGRASARIKTTSARLFRISRSLS